MGARKSRITLWIALLLLALLVISLLFIEVIRPSHMHSSPLQLNSGWQLQDAALAPQSGAELSQPSFKPAGWHPAIVPGTVLTSLVRDGTYPEPLYGENNRPNVIPDTLCRTNWWYRTVFTVPLAAEGTITWLHFDGINYAAEVWVNGQRAGEIRGAFVRGQFDITKLVNSGQPAAIAVLVSPQPHPGTPIQHNVKNGIGRNGGVTAIDGPTFLCTIGWDWLAGVPDRDTGIWRGVWISTSGPVTIQDPYVTTDLPLPRLDSADIAISATLVNHSGQARQVELGGSVEDEGLAAQFSRTVSIPANGTQRVAFTPIDTPQLRVKNPRLWWPNGYGPQNLYTLSLSATTGNQISDRRVITFGVRKVTYTVPGSPNLTISVNGTPVFCRGGDWGLDEALKRLPYKRLDAQIHMHQLANLNMIRNWVGQSTNDDFYDLCDRYGIMVWDEFFQPNPHDGPNPVDIATYIANARDKVLRFRNHPSIVVWCGRNEGRPPPAINTALGQLMAELDPVRKYQPSSTDGAGVKSGGPYYWRPPVAFYHGKEPFKTETGSVSIPTLESIQGMMPRKDWEVINDDWAQHDLARGAQRGDFYPGILRVRYGDLANLADFARKGQMANYEAFRAMYEGRNAQLFRPFTGVITWMSHPAQPSFVWQLYHYDLEANSSLYAVRKACEPVHIQMDESNGSIEVINNLPAPLAGATARVRLFNLDGSVASDRGMPAPAAASQATNLGIIPWPPGLTAVHFVKLELTGSDGRLISDNFYWHTAPGLQQDFSSLDTMPVVKLEVKASASGEGGKSVVNVTVRNPSQNIALMTHLQLRRMRSGRRVLPAYYSDNYFSLIPGETRSVTISADSADFGGEKPLVAVDGWNETVANTAGAVIPVPGPDAEGSWTMGQPVEAAAGAPAAGDVAVALNANAQVNLWPKTGLPQLGAPPLPRRAVVSPSPWASPAASPAVTGT